MTLNTEKDALRKHLLEKRDSISFDLIQIHSQKILSKLKKIQVFSDAESIGCSYSLGSEVLTNCIIKNLLDVKNLEKNNFDIPEPRENCPIQKKHDIILVPSIGLDEKGNRIGYGYGFYDRYLTKNESVKIALTYSKQIVKSIPISDDDIKMDWIVTETNVIKIS